MTDEGNTPDGETSTKLFRLLKFQADPSAQGGPDPLKFLRDDLPNLMASIINDNVADLDDLESLVGQTKGILLQLAEQGIRVGGLRESITNLDTLATKVAKRRDILRMAKEVAMILNTSPVDGLARIDALSEAMEVRRGTHNHD